MVIDDSLIADLARGSENSFKKIFQQTYSQVHRFALMLLKDKDDADDLCQIVFMKLWQRRERLVQIKNFDSYLFVLTKNTVLDYLAIHKVPTTTLDDDNIDGYYDLSPDELTVAKDTQLLIDMVVENMPTQRRTIYRMSREQHLKNEEIAQNLGLSKKTVENHLNLALKDIKKALRLAFFAFALWV